MKTKEDNSNIVKGFKDFTGKKAEKRKNILEIIKNIFEKYNFEKVETPIIEYEKFLKKQNSQDEVISDIFKLKDKGKRNLALRYEFTFQLKRISKNKKLPYKRYEIGEIFRDEPVQGNRLRQFVQCDIDVVGSSLKDEAEILAITKEILNNLNVKFKIYFNNRKLLNEILDELKIKKKQEVLKEIDKLDKLSEKEIKKNLKKYNAEKILDIIKQKENYFKKYEFYKEIQELKSACKDYNVELIFSPSLARGLSYYTGSIFEIKSDIRETICGGGSYLVDETPSTGISFGLDRLELVSKLNLENEKFLVISLGQDKKAIELSQKLRKKNKKVSIYYGKPSKALEYANSYNLNKVIFVGEKEVKENKFKIKDMKTGKETFLKL